MALRVDIAPELLRWACTRSQQPMETLKRRFPKLEQWLSGETMPTFKQLEAFATATRTPIGYFFLSHPPTESIPIPDLRTIGNEQIARPSPDLLETVYICQQRQEWYRDYSRSLGGGAVGFVGSAKLGDDVVSTASAMRRVLGFDLADRRKMGTWTEALRKFISLVEAAGVLVMVNGIVGSNTHRPLDPEEFRGFALSDALAPLVFVNGSDTKAAQMFTLAHELAHLWLGESALTDASPVSTPSNEIELWCNQVAAEFLAPLASVAEAYRPTDSLRGNLDTLAKRFKVSTLVIIRRIHDAGYLQRFEFWNAYQAELERVMSLPRKKSTGGDYYPTQALRVGRRFALALIERAREGQTGYRNAFRLLGMSKMETFDKLANHLKVA